MKAGSENPDISLRQFSLSAPSLEVIMTHAELTDAELVDRWRAGDEDAATILHERYLGRLLNLVGRHLAGKFNSRLDPDDVVQSVFRSIFRLTREGRFEFEGDSDFWKLLLTMALNKVRNTVRHHQAGKRDPSQESISTSADGVDGYIVNRLSSQPTVQEIVSFTDMLEQILLRLDPDQAALIQYRIEGYTQKEIAEKLNVDDRTVRRMFASIRSRGEELLGDDLTES
jgi:RNA polymerase sigma-70 factor (ECF subfamily)